MPNGPLSFVQFGLNLGSSRGDYGPMALLPTRPIRYLLVRLGPLLAFRICLCFILLQLLVFRAAKLVGAPSFAPSFGLPVAPVVSPSLLTTLWCTTVCRRLALVRFPGCWLAAMGIYGA